MGDQEPASRRGYLGIAAAPARPPATRFLYRAMHVDEFYELARRQGLAFGYQGRVGRVTEIWLSESLQRHSTSYIVSRQGRELSALAQLRVTDAVYEQVRAGLRYQHAGPWPAGTNFYNMERIMSTAEIRSRFGRPAQALHPSAFAELNPCIKNQQTLEQVNRAIQEIRIQGPGGEVFDHIVTPTGIKKAPGKVKMFMAKNYAVVLSVIIDVVLLSIAIHNSIKNRDARPAVETATVIATSSLAAYGMGIAIEGAGTAASAAATGGVALVVAAVVAVAFELLWKPETPPVFVPGKRGPGPPPLAANVAAVRASALLPPSGAAGAPALAANLSAVHGAPDLNACLKLISEEPRFGGVAKPLEASIAFVEDNSSLQVDQVVALLRNEDTSDVIVLSSEDTNDSFELLHELTSGPNAECIAMGVSRRCEDV